MKRQQARKILGNQSKYSLRNMAKALQMHPWLNMPDDWIRLCALKSLGYRVTITIPESYQDISNAMGEIQ